MAHSRLSDPEYRNWVTVGRAIQITRNGLETIIQNAADKYHTSLLAALSNNVHAWKSHLENAHRSRDKRKISWSNSDNTQWLTVGASWEIAKIFMAPLGSRKLDVVNAKTTDISGLLNVVEWSPRGTNGLFNTGVDLSKIADARSARNLWAHAPLLHISDADKVNAFASLTSLLQDPEMHHDKDVQDAIKKLSSLLNTGLAVIEEKELELFVQLQQQLDQDMVSLESDIICWKDEVGADLEQINDQIKGLDEFVKNNELHDALEIVNCRLEKLEEKCLAESQQRICDVEQELKFNPVSDRMKEEFVGREWLFSDIGNWLEKDLGPRESRAFLIWGSAGTGKSSFAQEFVRRHEGEKLAGYHYCQKDNPRTCDLKSLIYSLRSMLSNSLPKYAALVEKLQTGRFRDDPNKLFDLLITTPLQQLNESTRHFLVIDGLDEGGSMIASCLARLSGILPSWLRVILTARQNAPALSGLFLNSTSAKLDQFETGPESLSSKDICDFVSMKYRKLQTEYNYIPSFFANDEQVGKEKIVQASQNCFLYAKLVMEHIFDGHDEIGLPASLCEIYCLDFKRRIPDIEFFEKKVAPVLQTVLAIQSAKAFLRKEMRIIGMGKIDSSLKDNDIIIHLQKIQQAYQESDESVTGVVKCGLLPEIKTHDLNKVVKLLSGYLVKDDSGTYYFSHSSVGDWLQDEESDFFCDVLNGHSIMAKYNLKTLKVKYPSPGDFVENLCFRAKKPYPTAFLDLKFFSLRYLFHSSESESSNVNVLISELGIKAIDLLHAAFHWSDDSWDRFICSEYMAMKVLDETDVLNKMTIQEKAEHLELALFLSYARITAKLFDSRTYWIFSDGTMFRLNFRIKPLQLVPKESMPQLFFSSLVDFNFRVKIFEFCVNKGLTADVCVPQFFENTKDFNSSICWNEDVQEYFRKLKSVEKNVITLESLKEKPFCPKEAKVSEFTLEIIQKPLSEIERLLRNGKIYVEFKYAWHSLLQRTLRLNKADENLKRVEDYLKHGANPSNRGGPGVTALMLTCKKLNEVLRYSPTAEQVVSLLLVHGADVNQQDFYGRTALHYAFESRYDNDSYLSEERLDRKQRVVQILIQHSANIYLKDSSGLSAIDMAKRQGHESWLRTDEAALTGKRRLMKIDEGSSTRSKKGKTCCSIS
ncbi:Ankyrin repeat domain-containing 50 [Paramuricea clavata]|uniref:Ankyrin repeat domain-containing 50 n=1 Tax=Paramuricea clavata TaxID=317549 RepID=A0A6S7FVT3_PARCT|nr:Ankyrin repeat domain-containing 50 [Paramuricea clavata]